MILRLFLCLRWMIPFMIIMPSSPVGMKCSYCYEPSLSTDSIVAAALQAEKHGSYDEAVDLLGKVISREPYNESALLHRARVQILKRDFIAAAEDVDVVMELNPLNPAAYRYRGDSLAQQSAHEAAMPYYRRAIAIDPSDYESYARIGKLYYLTGMYATALAYTNTALSINSEYSEAYNNRGYIYQKVDQLDKAIADFSKAVELDPKYSIAYQNRGYAWIEKKEYQRAREDFNKALKIFPQSLSSLIGRAKASEALGETDDAVQDLTEAIDVHPTRSLWRGVYRLRGELYERLGDSAKASADLERQRRFEEEHEEVDAR